MKPTLHFRDAFILVVIALPFFYLAFVYNSLPAIVPTHFGADGKPNGFSNRSSMWGLLSILAGTSVFMFLLLRFLPNIDPKKTAKYSAGVFNKIAVAVVLLLTALNFLVVDAAHNGAFKFFRMFPVLMGCFFAFMGNIMHSIKPNYFAGIRTPWTLESEETWRLTHQFGGKVWFVGGLLIAVVSFFIPEMVIPYYIISTIGILAFVPIIYSYITYRAIKKRDQ